MTPQQIEHITRHPDFIQLVRRKQRLYWSLTLIMLLAYYGFVLLVAFHPGLLGRSLSGGATSIGMPVGVAMIVLAIALTGFYVHYSNRRLDPLNARLKRECQS
ncbi:DUF485 domain-containing protein [Pseudomonas sp. NFXW11]|uniref:DUF485 domain-containing protein n=1 Tax=Pseudomonas sp. NFXW11 TaxID=2819531 RepID=UPI003CE7F5DC